MVEAAYKILVGTDAVREDLQFTYYSNRPDSTIDLETPGSDISRGTWLGAMGGRCVMGRSSPPTRCSSQFSPSSPRKEVRSVFLGICAFELPTMPLKVFDAEVQDGPLASHCGLRGEQGLHVEWTDLRTELGSGSRQRIAVDEEMLGRLGRLPARTPRGVDLLHESAFATGQRGASVRLRSAGDLPSCDRR